MRIGLISGEYPPMEGGVGDFTRMLGRALITSGHEVHVLTTAEAPARQKEQAAQEMEGLIIHRRRLRWGPRSAWTILAWAEPLALEILNLQYQAAAYHLRGWINLVPYLTRHRRSIPWVTTFHDLLPPYLFPKAGRLRQEAVQHLATTSDGIIVTNAEDETRLRKEAGNRLPPLRRIPIGSNITPTPPPDFAPRQWREDHHVPPQALLLGFFGFLNRSKGVEVLLEATARLVREGHPVRLVFIGGRTGSSDASNRTYAEGIEARIAQLGLGPYLLRTGFAAPEAISAALLSCDLCVLPYRDGASLRRGTLHAALAHGCAIITTEPRFPLPELEGAACFIPTEDAEALHAAILHLWQAAERRQQLATRAREVARRFTWEAIAAETAAFFATLRGTGQ